MTQDASTIIGGPAIVTFNSAIFYVEGDITVKVTKQYKARTVGGFGSLPKKIIDVQVDVIFKPSQYKNTSVLFPYFALAMGTAIMGSSDTPLVIQSMTEGLKYTYKRAALWSSPALGLGVKKDLLGNVTFRCVKGNTTELSAANSIVTEAASAYSDTSFDITKLYDLPYAMAWGASPFDAIESEDGIDVTTDYDFAPMMMNGAIIDYKLKDARMKAAFTPANLSHANLLILANYQAIARGTALAPTGANDLVMTGPITGSPLVTLKKAYPTDCGLVFDVSKHAAAKFTFEASRTFSTGAAQAIASLSTAP